MKIVIANKPNDLEGVKQQVIDIESNVCVFLEMDQEIKFRVRNFEEERSNGWQE